MGASLFAPCEEDPKTMQSTVGRVVGPWYSQGRMVEGRRREAATSGEVDANTMAYNRPYCRKDSNTMP